MKQEPGYYTYDDGTIIIRRELSQQTGRPDEVCWGVYVNGRLLGHQHWDTKREAIQMAKKAGCKLISNGGQK